MTPTPNPPKPVHELSREEALAEYESLLDTKPADPDTSEATAWNRANAQRCEQLQAWLMMHPDPAQAAPEIPVDEAVHPPRAIGAPPKSLNQRLEELGETLVAIKAHPQDKKLRVRFYNQRHAIRKVPGCEDIPLPDLPNARGTSKNASAAPPPAQIKVQAPKPPACPVEASAPSQAIVRAPRAAQRDELSGIRTNIWQLLQRMEGMDHAARAQLRPGISLLLSGVTQALQLASGWDA